MKPFPFLGHTNQRGKKVSLWRVGATTEFVSFERLPDDVESWPVSLVVWPKSSRWSSWHRDSVLDERLHDALARIVRSAPQYDAPVDTAWYATPGVEIEQAVLASLHRDRAKLLSDALTILNATEGEHRAVVRDLLFERLPALTGFDFECDVVIRNALASMEGIVTSALPRSNVFSAAILARVRAAHAAASRPLPPGAIDWSKPESVLEAMAQSSWPRLAISLREANEDHVRTLLSFTDEQRLALAKGYPMLALRMSNAASLLLEARDFENALTLYDAAIEGTLPVGALANPLFAAQNDNNKLGLDEKRSRRYLERCVTDGGIAMMFINAVFVAAELHEFDDAMKYLTKAKSLGIAVFDHRNDPLLAPMRDREDFIAVMVG